VFHLIGVGHPAQKVRPGDPLNADQNRLSDCVSYLIKEVKPALIAEEQSPEGLGKNISIPQRLAGQAGIEHRFCDPDSKQRAAMGYRDRQALGWEMFMGDDAWNLSSIDIDAKAGAIEIARYLPMREQFWLDRVADRLESEVAFVCGDVHIEGFAALLKKKGIPSRIVDRAIGDETSARGTGRKVSARSDHHLEQLRAWVASLDKTL
jgi:hypothetical protein